MSNEKEVFLIAAARTGSRSRYTIETDARHIPADNAPEAVQELQKLDKAGIDYVIVNRLGQLIGTSDRKSDWIKTAAPLERYFYKREVNKNE